MNSSRSRSGGRRPRSEPHVVELGGVPTMIHVRRHPQARRTSLRISANGDGVVLVMPECKRLQDGFAVARAHAAWIRDRLQALPPRVLFAPGAVLPVQGQAVVIRHDASAGPRSRVCLRQAEGVLLVGGAEADLPHRVERWLRNAARRAIETCAAAKVERLGRAPAKVVIRDTRSRWGSCSPSGVLSFSWRLVLAPPEVLDYVVAHEMAHLRFRGHGADFWAAVATLTADPAAGRAWLRREGATLFRYG